MCFQTFSRKLVSPSHANWTGVNAMLETIHAKLTSFDLREGSLRITNILKYIEVKQISLGKLEKAILTRIEY